MVWRMESVVKFFKPSPQINLGLGFLIFFLMVSQACGDSNNVATYKGGAITQKELDEAAGMELYRHELQLYETRYRKLIQTLGERLVELEARESGKTAEELISAYIEESAPEVTDDFLKMYYNSQNFQQPFGAIKEELRGELQRQLKGRAKYEYYQELMTKYEAEITLKKPEAPKVDVKIEGLPFWGKEDAEVVIIEFSDYECPYCKSIQPEIQKVKEEFSDQIKWVFFDFPLSFHRQALFAHVAAHCAGRQGAYFDMHMKIFLLAPNLSPEKIRAAAKTLPIDYGAFEECAANSKPVDELIKANIEEALRVGINATPTLIIQGSPANVRNYEELKREIEKHL